MLPVQLQSLIVRWPLGMERVGRVKKGSWPLIVLIFFVVWTLRLGLRPSHQFDDLSTHGQTQPFQIPSKLGCRSLSRGESPSSHPDGSPSASFHFLTLAFQHLLQGRHYTDRRCLKRWDRPWAHTGGVTLQHNFPALLKTVHCGEWLYLHFHSTSIFT